MSRTDQTPRSIPIWRQSKVRLRAALATAVAITAGAAVALSGVIGPTSFGRGRDSSSHAEVEPQSVPRSSADPFRPYDALPLRDRPVPASCFLKHGGIEQPLLAAAAGALPHAELVTTRDLDDFARIKLLQQLTVGNNVCVGTVPEGAHAVQGTAVEHAIREDAVDSCAIWGTTWVDNTPHDVTPERVPLQIRVLGVTAGVGNDGHRTLIEARRDSDFSTLTHTVYHWATTLPGKDLSDRHGHAIAVNVDAEYRDQKSKRWTPIKMALHGADAVHLGDGLLGIGGQGDVIDVSRCKVPTTPPQTGGQTFKPDLPSASPTPQPTPSSSGLPHFIPNPREGGNVPQAPSTTSSPRFAPAATRGL